MSEHYRLWKAYESGISNLEEASSRHGQERLRLSQETDAAVKDLKARGVATVNELRQKASQHQAAEDQVVQRARRAGVPLGSPAPSDPAGEPDYAGVEAGVEQVESGSEAVRSMIRRDIRAAEERRAARSVQARVRWDAMAMGVMAGCVLASFFVNAVASLIGVTVDLFALVALLAGGLLMVRSRSALAQWMDVRLGPEPTSLFLARRQPLVGVLLLGALIVGAGSSLLLLVYQVGGIGGILNALVIVGLGFGLAALTTRGVRRNPAARGSAAGLRGTAMFRGGVFALMSHLAGYVGAVLLGDGMHVQPVLFSGMFMLSLLVATVGHRWRRASNLAANR